MQIFGQVWLWSLGSFLLGVLFTWLLLVRPARRRVTELESAAGQPREFRQPTRVAEPVGGPPTGKEADRFLDDLFDSPKPSATSLHQQVQPPTLPPPMPPQLPPPPMPASAQPGPTAPPELPPMPDSVTGSLTPPAPQQQSFSSRLDPQAPPEPPIPDESDTELSDSPFRQFTESTTVFVPPADLRIPDKAESSGEDWFAKENDSDPHLITDVEDDEKVDDQGTIFTQHTTPIPEEMIRSLDETPPQQQPEPEAAAPEPQQQYDPPLPEPVQHYEPPLPEPVQQYDPPLPEPEFTQHIEPPRLPDPEPVAHTEPEATQRFEPAPAPAAATDDSSRSLFEPVVPVADEEAAAAADQDGFVPPGPFGPGSAMPLPGGGAPAPEFNVKASVTALRYCTQENPQFDRIVAEVWFRSPSDAERVGFRVLS